MARRPLVLGQPVTAATLPSYQARALVLPNAAPPQRIDPGPTPEQRRAAAGGLTDALDAGMTAPLGGGGIGEALARFGESYLRTRAAGEQRLDDEQERLEERVRERHRREALASAISAYDPTQPAQAQQTALIQMLGRGAPEDAFGLLQGDIQGRVGHEREQLGAREQYAWQRRFDNENPEAITPYQRETLNLQRAQLAQGRGGGASAPPAGYRWTREGNLEAVPGGPADIRATAAGQARAGRLEASARSLGNAVSVLDQALGMVDSDSAGLWGQITRGVGGTDAYDLNQALEPVRAILSFENLAEMRRNSETGGALGSIAVRELDLLGATIRSLDTAQSPGALRNAIIATREQLARTLSAVQAARQELIGGAPGVSPSAEAPSAPRASPSAGSAPRVRTYNPRTGRLE